MKKVLLKFSRNSQEKPMRETLAEVLSNEFCEMFAYELLFTEHFMQTGSLFHRVLNSFPAQFTIIEFYKILQNIFFTEHLRELLLLFGKKPIIVFLQSPKYDSGIYVIIQKVSLYFVNSKLKLAILIIYLTYLFFYFTV